MIKKILYRSVLFLLILLPVTIVYLHTVPKFTSKLDTVNLTSVSATLSNSRLSYRAGVATGAANSSTVTIYGASNADNDTKHLFTKDVVCFSGSLLNGCHSQVLYTVANIADDTNFNFTPDLGALALSANDYVIATQSGAMTIQFTTVNAIPAGGDIFITIPAVDTDNKTCDGFPDTGPLANNGFDLKGVAAGDITVSGACATNWTVQTPSCGTSSANHTIRIDRSASSCDAGSAVTVTIDSSPGVINPAPVNVFHTQGTADVYQINVKTRDGSGATLDNSDVTVAPIEGVFVSATVDETLSFAVAAVTADSGSYCGVTRDATSPNSTVYSIPWDTISSNYSPFTHNAAQQLTVSTNAVSGYKVYIEENDQMGKNGNVCTGATPSTDGFTFTGPPAGTCIRDTLCNATGCSHTAAYDWATPGSFYGFGYSLANQAGTDAKFVYNSNVSPCTAATGTGAASFCAKTPADKEAGENQGGLGSLPSVDSEIMTSSVPVSGSSVYACYRIAIGGTQPAGYYYNKIKYTAVPTF